MISLLIVAGSPIERAGLESMLREHASLSIAGSTGAAGLAEALDVHHPDVVLVTPEPEGEQAVSALVGEEHGPPMVVVVLADEPSGPWAFEALRGGVRAILARSATGPEIAAAVEAAAAGLVVLHPELSEAMLPAPAPSPQARGGRRAGEQPLTPREVEVLRMLAEGLGNKEIAWRLEISEHTVKFHIASIFTKLGASSRTEAVTMGIRKGLVLV